MCLQLQWKTKRILSLLQFFFYLCLLQLKIEQTIHALFAFEKQANAILLWND